MINSPLKSNEKMTRRDKFLFDEVLLHKGELDKAYEKMSEMIVK